MPSSGTTAVATTSADPKVALAADTRHLIAGILVNNTGDKPGFFSFEPGSDGNPEYHYIPASASVFVDLKHRPRTSPAVSLLRIGADDMTGVYVSTW